MYFLYSISQNIVTLWIVFIKLYSKELRSGVFFFRNRISFPLESLIWTSHHIFDLSFFFFFPPFSTSLASSYCVLCCDENPSREKLVYTECGYIVYIRGCVNNAKHPHGKWNWDGGVPKQRPPPRAYRGRPGRKAHSTRQSPLNALLILLSILRERKK